MQAWGRRLRDQDSCSSECLVGLLSLDTPFVLPDLAVGWLLGLRNGQGDDGASQVLRGHSWGQEPG